MPPWLLPILLVAGAYRLTRLISKDDFPPVLWVRDHLAGGWRPLTIRELETYGRAKDAQKEELERDWSYDPHDELHQRYVHRSKRSPYWLADLITCPWCVSAYVSLALVGGTWFTVGLPVPPLMWLAVWGASSWLASREWA
jgi:hypothetical protein